MIDKKFKIANKIFKSRLIVELENIRAFKSAQMQ